MGRGSEELLHPLLISWCAWFDLPVFFAAMPGRPTCLFLAAVPDDLPGPTCMVWPPCLLMQQCLTAYLVWPTCLLLHQCLTTHSKCSRFSCSIPLVNLCSSVWRLMPVDQEPPPSQALHIKQVGCMQLWTKANIFSNRIQALASARRPEVWVAKWPSHPSLMSCPCTLPECCASTEPTVHVGTQWVQRTAKAGEGKPHVDWSSEVIHCSLIQCTAVALGVQAHIFRPLDYHWTPVSSVGVHRGGGRGPRCVGIPACLFCWGCRPWLGCLWRSTESLLKESKWWSCI